MALALGGGQFAGGCVAYFAAQRQCLIVRRKILTMLNPIFFLVLLTLCSTKTETTFYTADTTFLTEQNAKDTLHLYFPLKDSKQDSTDNLNSLDTFTNVWYSKMLAAMKEPVLTDYDGDIKVYRFTWLRTFHKPIMVRIEKVSDTVILNAKVLSGAGGYDPGKIIIDTTLRLTLKTWDDLQQKIETVSFWTLPIETDFRGNDGAEWILEGSTKEKYHFITRWSPGKQSSYRSLCLFLYNLSGLKVSKQDTY